VDPLYDWLGTHRTQIEHATIFALFVLGLYIIPGLLDAACLGRAPC
jgi:hypothetical protein